MKSFQKEKKKKNIKPDLKNSRRHTLEGKEIQAKNVGGVGGKTSKN